MPKAKLIPLILAGGSGTRLWPLSRGKMPKQFIGLVGDRSTYQQTLERFDDTTLFATPMVVTNSAFQSLAVQQARDVGMDVIVVLEPARRDSCAAILAGALVAAGDRPDTPVLAVPADHVIAECEPFLAAVRRGLDAVDDGRILVFGVKPTEPRTSFGYIRPGETLGEGLATVAEFVEKPDAATAQRFVDEGLLWNAGKFLFRADVLAGQVKAFEPAIHDAVLASVTQARRWEQFVKLDEAGFAEAPARSLDHAVMEKTDQAGVVIADYAFCDVGSWDAVLNANAPDPDGNRLVGEVKCINSRNCYVHSEGCLTAVIGLSDVVVVTSPDAVLVASRAGTQQIKELVADLAAERNHLVAEHVRSHRPWGWYQEVDRGDRFRVKRIVVEPGGRLSLQKHFHRAEHWVVVRGTAEVTVGDKVTSIRENEGLYVPPGHIHRLANPGRIPLELIEVQIGSYLEEDDIVRLDDQYNRT